MPLPQDFVFDLANARLLVNGSYKHEDDDDEAVPDLKFAAATQNAENNNVLGRAMLNGNPNDP